MCEVARVVTAVKWIGWALSVTIMALLVLRWLLLKAQGDVLTLSPSPRRTRALSEVLPIPVIPLAIGMMSSLS